MEDPGRFVCSQDIRRKKLRRKLLGIFILAVLIWRAWPVAAAFTGWNLRGAVVTTPLSEYFLPPKVKPDEICSGMAHPHFDLAMFATQVMLCPRSIRHGHAFWSNDPALTEAKATRLAEILASPETYEPWLGEKACGGFHADWYIRWGQGDEKHEVIICEGCHEALVFYAGGYVRCDLSKEGFEKISATTGQQ